MIFPHMRTSFLHLNLGWVYSYLLPTPEIDHKHMVVLFCWKQQRQGVNYSTVYFLHVCNRLFIPVTRAHSRNLIASLQLKGHTLMQQDGYWLCHLEDTCHHQQRCLIAAHSPQHFQYPHPQPFLECYLRLDMNLHAPSKALHGGILVEQGNLSFWSTSASSRWTIQTEKLLKKFVVFHWVQILCWIKPKALGFTGIRAHAKQSWALAQFIRGTARRNRKNGES